MNAAARKFHGLRVAKSPSSLMSFCSPSYFPANHCCFACVSFHIPVLPFPPALHSFPRTFRFVQRTFAPKILLGMPAPGPSSSVLPHIPLPFPSCISFSFPYFPCLSLTYASKILLSRIPPPGYFLPFPIALLSRTSLYCFFLSLFFRIFLKNLFEIRFGFLIIWFLFIQCCSFCFEFDASSCVCLHFVLI